LRDGEYVFTESVQLGSTACSPTTRGGRTKFRSFLRVPNPFALCPVIDASPVSDVGGNGIADEPRGAFTLREAVAFHPAQRVDDGPTWCP
jgi:hypothetical protein